MPLTPEEDVPGLRELNRAFTDFRAEYRSNLPQFVRADLYGVQYNHLLARVASIEQENAASRAAAQKDWEELRRSVRNGMLGGGFAIIVSIITAVLGLK